MCWKNDAEVRTGRQEALRGTKEKTSGCNEEDVKLVGRDEKNAGNWPLSVSSMLNF